LWQKRIITLEPREGVLKIRAELIG
jgi:hypothetical protein